MSRVQTAAAGFLRQLTRVEQAIAVGGLLLTAVALLVDIFAREVLYSSIFGSLRIAVYSTAFAALIGFCVCVASNSHIRVSIFDGLTPPSWRPAIYRLADVVSFAICIVFAWFAVNYVWQTYLVGETDVSLNVVIWPFQLVLVWMFVSAALRYGLFAIYPALRPQEEEIAQ